MTRSLETFKDRNADITGNTLKYDEDMSMLNVQIHQPKTTNIFKMIELLKT